MGFLTDLVSLDGRNVIVGIKPDDIVHRWLSFSDTAAVADAIDRLQARKYDVYFGLGAYAPNVRELTRTGGRLAANVVSLKGFWYDIDAGPEKIAKARAMKSPRARENKLANLYETYEDASAGLGAALLRTQLPMPTHIVKSGNGLHVYWGTEETMTVEEWTKVQTALDERLRAGGLRIDPSRSLDVASILRPPGTIHRGATKAAGRNVKVKLVEPHGTPIPLEELLEGIVATKLTGSMKPKPASRAASPAAAKAVAETTRYGVTQAMIDASNKRVARGDPPETVKNIAVLLEILGAIPADVGRDEWFRVVWAIKATGWECSYEAACDWSRSAEEKYPEWERETLKVWESDKSTSNEGRFVGVGTLFALAEDYGLPNKHFFYDGEAAADDAVEMVLNDTVVEYHIPAMPENFWRKKKEPGLWTRVAVVNGVTGETEDHEDIKFYDNDLYITDRINDEGGKFRLSMMHYLPNDGVRRLNIPYTALSTVAELRTELIEYDILANGERGWVHMSRYLLEQAKMFTAERAATARIDSLGWQRDGSFVIGSHAIERDKSVRPIVAVGNLEEMLDVTEPQGSLDEWKKIAAFYNHPKFECAQFSMALAMGCPLYSFSGFTGAVVNMYSEGSGVGKTSVLRTAASVWGDPGHSGNPTNLIFGNTTDNSMQNHMVRMGSLPAMYDEITADVGDKRKMDSLRAFIRYSTHSSDKQRMKSGSNELRKNTAFHSNFALCTANRPLESIFPDMSADAERARTLDVPFAAMPKLHTVGIPERDSLQAFSFGISENSGVAGRVLLDYYIKHHDAIKRRIQDTQLRYSEHGATTRDRFIVALCATAVVACEIANELGLVEYDPQIMFDYSLTLIGTQRAASKAGTVSDEDILNEFIRHNSEHLLLTKVHSNGTSYTFNGRVPRAPCMGRWYLNVNQLYVVRHELVSFCHEHRIDPLRVFAWLHDRNAITQEKVRMDLGAGITDYKPGRHQCVVIDPVAAGLESPKVEEGEKDE